MASKGLLKTRYLVHKCIASCYLSIAPLLFPLNVIDANIECNSLSVRRKSHTELKLESWLSVPSWSQVRDAHTTGVSEIWSHSGGISEGHPKSHD